MIVERLRKFVWILGLLFGFSAIGNAFLTYRQFVEARRIERLDASLASVRSELEIRQAFMTELIAFAASRPKVGEILQRYHVPLNQSPGNIKP